MESRPEDSTERPLNLDAYQFLRQRSLPVTMKKLAPPVPAVAFLYSEDQMKVFDIFETKNLRQCINTQGKINITRVFTQDINARIGWVRCADAAERNNLYKTLQQRFGTLSAETDLYDLPF